MTLEGTPLKVIMALLFALAVLLIWRALAHRSTLAISNIDLDDLLLGEDGRLSKAAAVMMGAFGVTTWIMVYMTLQGKMTEGYFAAYMAAWVGPTVTKLIVGARATASSGTTS